MLSSQEIKSKYGEPDELGGYLVTIVLPYPMRLAWDIKSKVSKMRCHKLAKDKFLGVFNDLLKEYGIEKLQELEIDLFGGCFNYRAMRGGSDWSTHTWGIAIDLSPEKNALKTTWAKCQFSKPEYKKMIEIFYKHGFISLGLEKNYDGMHFQLKD